jgi:hypothetical protein
MDLVHLGVPAGIRKLDGQHPAALVNKYSVTHGAEATCRLLRLAAKPIEIRTRDHGYRGHWRILRRWDSGADPRAL